MFVCVCVGGGVNALMCMNVSGYLCLFVCLCVYFVLKSVFVYLCRGCVTEVGWARYYFCLFLYMYVCVYMLGEE